MSAALQDAQAREAFRQQYSEFTRSRALELTRDERMADALAARALSTLEERYARRSLPADPQLAILTQLNIAYAQGDYQKEAAAPALAPVSTLEPLGAPAPLQPQVKPLANPVYSMANMTETDLERLYAKNTPGRRAGRTAQAPVQAQAEPLSAPQSRASRRTARNAAMYETAAELTQPQVQPVTPIQPPQVQPVVQVQPPLPQVQPAAQLQPAPAPVAPAPPTVNMPTVQPAPTVAQVETFTPTDAKLSAPAAPAAPKPAESAPEVELDAVGVPINKDVAYDPGQTILWQAGSSFSPAQVIETVHEQQEQQEPVADPNARSVLMTVINTVLLLLCVGAAVFLVLQLFPNLFSGLLQ